MDEGCNVTVNLDENEYKLLEEVSQKLNMDFKKTITYSLGIVSYFVRDRDSFGE